VQFSLEAMDGDKAQFLRKTMDKAQFPLEAMDRDKPCSFLGRQWTRRSILWRQWTKIRRSSLGRRWTRRSFLGREWTEITQFLWKTMDKAQFSWEGMDGDNTVSLEDNG
jgi:hypothetical protein